MLKIYGREYSCFSSYAPTQQHTQERITYFAEIQEMRLARSGRHQVQIWSGDLNSHVGRDASALSDDATFGGYGMDVPTKRPGKQLVEWLKEGLPALQLADSYHSIHRRGTFPWMDGSRSRWFELDVFLTSPQLTKRMHNWKVFALSFSDHFGKACKIALKKKPDKERHWRLGGSKRVAKLKLHEMSGKEKRHRKKLSNTRPFATQG